MSQTCREHTQQVSHVIIFINNYQSQTLCRQIEQAGATLQQQLSNAAAMQHTGIQCVQSARDKI